MKFRQRKDAAPPEDEFLRVVKASHHPQSPPESSDEPASEQPEAAPEAASEEEDGATVAQVREEAERRLADARAAIERERERREQAERALEAVQGPDATPEDAEELARRRDEVAEAERSLREERERWEVTAERQTERRVRELAEAERRITEARKERDATEQRGRTDAPVPANGHAEAGGMRRWLGLGRSGGTDGAVVCTVCARKQDDSESEEQRAEWIVTEQAAVCASCHADGWSLPAGGRLPVRRAASHGPPDDDDV